MDGAKGEPHLYGSNGVVLESQKVLYPGRHTVTLYWSVFVLVPFFCVCNVVFVFVPCFGSSSAHAQQLHSVFSSFPFVRIEHSPLIVPLLYCFCNPYKRVCACACVIARVLAAVTPCLSSHLHLRP